MGSLAQRRVGLEDFLFQCLQFVEEILHPRVDLTSHTNNVKHFTHIEVPLAHVVKTEKFLLEKGITLPVLPMEYGELVSSKMPLKKLLWPLMK